MRNIAFFVIGYMIGKGLFKLIGHILYAIGVVLSALCHAIYEIGKFLWQEPIHDIYLGMKARVLQEYRWYKTRKMECI